MKKNRITAFLVAAFLAVGILSVGGALYSLQRIESALESASAFQSQVLFDILNVDNTVMEMVQEGFAYVLSGDVGERDEFFELHDRLDVQLAKFESEFSGSDRARLLIDEITAGQEQLTRHGRRMFDDYEANGSVQASSFYDFETIVDDLGESLDEFILLAETDVRQAELDTLAVVTDAKRLVFGQGILALALALLAAMVVARYLNRAFNRHNALEQQLLQSQKMDAVGQLAGGVAHDFNNYLTVINGAAQFILENQDQNVEFWTRQIIDAGKRTADLTNQLLAFSRKQVRDPQSVDLNKIVQDLMPLLQQTIGEHVAVELVPDTGIGRLSADRSQLEQVIVNLVLNARDAMPQGGVITLETASISLGEEFASANPGINAGRHTMLAVSDTGTGIDPAIRDRIFEPFVTTKAIDKGTGLGLATVYSIVTQHGGAIKVYSEIGHGTTFKIFLPCTEVERRQEVLQAPVVKFTGAGIVLLVEDDAMVRTVTRALLEAIGFEVLDAPNGAEGLAILQEHTDIRLLLTDITMPVMGGIELAEKARALRPAMRVLYMSGYTQNGIVHHGEVDAGYVLLQKPFTRADLIRKLSETLDNAASLPDDEQQAAQAQIDWLKST